MPVAVRDLQLDVTWMAPSTAIPEVLTVKNFREDASSITIGPIQERSYTYRHPVRSASCELYLFAVAAINSAGMSNSRDGFIITIPKGT